MPTNFSTSQTTPDKFYQQPQKQRKNLRQLIKTPDPKKSTNFYIRIFSPRLPTNQNTY